MSEPRIYRLSYSHNHGLAATFDFSLTTANTTKSKASFSLSLYSLDYPVWGFRAAADKYYHLFLQLFEKRGIKEGL
jgi:galactose mutarotase-like enzyme